MADAYGLLGLRPGADEQEVRRAYRSAVRRLHPDLQPEHLREQSGRRLQAVNAARMQVLREIRRGPTQQVPDGPAPFVPRQRRPARAAGEDGHDLARRRAERQAWLREQRRGIDDWNRGRRAREELRGRQVERELLRRRHSLHGGRGRLGVLVAVLTLQVGLLWGAVTGVERVISAVSVHVPVLPRDHGDLDLREVLTFLDSWRS